MAPKSYPVGREILNDICRYLPQLNSKDGIIRRFEFIMQFASGGGRSGEGATASANGCYWNSQLTFLTLNWIQMKTRRQDIINYVNDWEFYEIRRRRNAGFAIGGIYFCRPTQK